MATIFSKIVKGEIPSYKVAEDENFYAFLDINPLVKGHTLVIPKREVDYIFDLEDDEIAAMQVFDVIYMIIDYNNPALKKTESLVYLFYKYSFEQSKKGYGATVVVILLAVIMLLTVVQLIGQKKWVHYE